MARAENINPIILTWARETAGLSLDDAADSIGFTAGARLSPAQRLEELESGAASPTRVQLAKLASIYRRPLITFYLKQPPPKGVRGEDFRTSAGNISDRENAMLDALLRDIRARQEMVKSLLEDEDEREPLTFVGSMRFENGVATVAENIASTLGVALDQFPQSKRSPDDLFRTLRAKAERVGIFVVLAGDLGSHHSVIGDSVFRGFAIADSIAPFVVINDQDAKAARSFTLLHELVHIWLGQTGISGGEEVADATSGKGGTEQFCDDVASAVLLPPSAFSKKPAGFDGSDEISSQKYVTEIAAFWGVSEPAVAYRLRRMNWISPQVHRGLQAAYAIRWRSLKQRAKTEVRGTDGGPSFYTVKQFKLGDALVDVVRRSLRNEDLSYTKAAKLLGVKPANVEPLIRRTEDKRNNGSRKQGARV